MKEDRMRLFESPIIIKSFLNKYGNSHKDIINLFEVNFTDISKETRSDMERMKADEINKNAERRANLAKDFKERQTAPKESMASKNAKWEADAPKREARRVASAKEAKKLENEAKATEKFERNQTRAKSAIETKNKNVAPKPTVKAAPGTSPPKWNYNNNVAPGTAPAPRATGIPAQPKFNPVPQPPPTAPRATGTPVQPKFNPSPIVPQVPVNPAPLETPAATSKLAQLYAKHWTGANNLKRAGIVGAGLAVAGGAAYGINKLRKPTTESVVSFAKYGVKKFAESQIRRGVSRDKVIENIVENLRVGMNLCSECDNPSMCKAKLANEIAIIRNKEK